MKRCPTCGERKELTDFHKNACSPDGRQYLCKPCKSAQYRKAKEDNPEKLREQSRRWRCDNPRAAWSIKLKNRYGITADDWEVLLEAQGGGCAICGTTTNLWDTLFVDHNHETGRVRGLLCNACNLVLGYAQDSPERLRAAAVYLERAHAGVSQES